MTLRPAGQRLRFATSKDGVRLAWTVEGEGPPLIRVAHWLSHLELDRTNIVWREFLGRLGHGRTLVRYDERGTGLSDRNVADLSFEAMVGDLETVADAAGFERFSLLGMSQGGAISIAYAVRHPERIRALVLCGAYARGHAHRGRTAAQREQAAVLLELMRIAWGTDDPKFRHVFSRMFMPDGTDEQLAAFEALQRASADGSTAHRLRTMFDSIDVLGLCSRVAAPTVVMHVRGDDVVPFEESRILAALIPHSRFVPLEGRGHALLPGSEAFEAFFGELEAFLSSVEAERARLGAGRPDRSPLEGGVDARLPGTAVDGFSPAGVDRLSARELDVMRLVIAGHGNDQIAERLFLSPRTVERHLSNVYAKLGVEGKAARAAAAARVATSGILFGDAAGSGAAISPSARRPPSPRR